MAVMKVGKSSILALYALVFMAALLHAIPYAVANVEGETMGENVRRRNYISQMFIKRCSVASTTRLKRFKTNTFHV